MKKTGSFLLAFIMLISCIGMVHVSAEDYVEVSTVQALKEALECDGSRSVFVTGDIIYTCQVRDVGEYWITLGQGEKKLNLNGKSVELNAETGSETTMIKVPKGASLVIDDTSGDHSGKLFCYGRMESPRDDEGIPRYFNDTVKYRNVLEVDGGLVTVNGGTLEAGRSKKYWIYNGRDIYGYRHQTDFALQGGILAWTIGVRYDGDAWQQVNGDCITVNDGSLLVNDGIFLGRGFSHLETYVDDSPDMDVDFGRSACLRLKGGATNISGGTFWGRGNADVFHVTQNAKVSVKSGTFSTNHLRVIEVPTIIVTQTGFYEPLVIGSKQRYGDKYHPASDPGNIKISADMLDPQRNTAELNGEMLPVSEWSKLMRTSDEGASTIVITHHMSNTDRRNHMSGSDTRKKVNSLDIDGTYAYGMSLSPDLLSCDAESVNAVSVEWYHNDEPAGEDEQLVAGKYQVKAAVMLKSGYAFSDSPSFTIMGERVSDYQLSSSKNRAVLWSGVYNMECNHSYNVDEYLHFGADKHYLKCSVCGEIISSEAHSFGDGVQNEDVITYQCQECDYTYHELNDGKTKLTYINISLPVPEPGKKPEYSGVIGGEGVSFADGGDEYTKNGIRWSKSANDFGVAENDLFVGDFKYRATLYLKADEGYAFHQNHKGEYDTEVYVNGEAVQYEVSGDLMTVVYDVFTPEVIVSSIDLMGIDFPEIGNTPDNEPISVMPHYYDIKDDAGAISWYEDGKYMHDTDAFKAGKTYSVELYVDAVRVGWDDVVTFAETPVVTLNGFTVDANDVRRINDTTVALTYTFPTLEEEKTEEPEKPQETEKPSQTEKPSESEKPSGTDKPSQTEKPENTGKPAFTDVPKGEYYYEPVMWAVENGITSGTGANTFSPNSNCNRAQVVTFLHRMIGSPEPAEVYMPFMDVAEISFYYKPVKWAVGSGITGGTSENTFSPDMPCTRAQVVTFLWRTAGQPQSVGKNNKFIDVAENSFYYDAVLWAVENGITGGTGENTFSPDAPCTRAHVVTFLYRFSK
ncbi:MAG: S-layer homology domain-containing protein [Clostridia bacterium]|nr:S-layer homology domain-containing protein [Clostridia bacterium]